MSWLMQRIEREPALSMPGRAVQFTGGYALGDQPLQPAREYLPQLFADRALPVLVVRAAAHGEACQEVVTIQLDRPLQRSGVRTRDQVLEVTHVDGDVPGPERDGRPANRQRGTHDRGGHRQRAPQRCTRLLAVGVWPQQAGQLLAAVLAAGDGEQ